MLDIRTLETWLWSAACSIRGALDAPKYKDYILPLVFIKRLSDVFDDEIERLSDQLGSKEIALSVAGEDSEVVRYYVPPECSWQVIRTHSEKGLGEKLTTITRELAKLNPELDGVINIIDFNETRRGQRILEEASLSKLVEVISRHRLGMKDAEPDILGRAYEYLLRKFAEGQGQSAGEFYTPKEVGWLMAYLLDPKQGQTVYDPACGSGGLLVKCQLVLQENEKEITRPLRLFGQEQNHVTYAMAKMNMALHDMEGEIAIGDTLKNPKLITPQGTLQQFDLVTANPMWNQDGYDSAFYEQDKYGRFKYGFLNQQSADWGWVQHMLASLTPSGKAAVVLDTGAVSRGSGNASQKNKEKEVRKALVEEDIVEAVVLMPDNLFYNTTAPGIILVLNKNKPKDRNNKVMLINLSDKFVKSTEAAKNLITEEGIIQARQAYLSFDDSDGYAKVVSLEEIRKNDYNLSPSRYIHNGSVIEAGDPALLWNEIQSLQIEEATIDKTIAEIMNKVLISKKDI